ncbi:MAG: hypothetical protein WAN46_10580 [Gammaproteobacteria bacterium]|jgi:hypothetical protein
MRSPDFAHTDLEHLESRDLQFIIEHFPLPGRSYEEIARLVHTLPTTLESLLNSDYLFREVCGETKLLLNISPFLLFSVLLRRNLRDHRAKPDRKIINYLANLLSLFIRADRLFRVEPHDRRDHKYLVDLISEGEAANARRQFLIHSHIGNYALFISGLFPAWIEHRYRYQRRPINGQFYIDMGRTYFQRAATHPMAHELGLDDVFLRLALLFEAYKRTLNEISSSYLKLS